MARGLSRREFLTLASLSPLVLLPGEKSRRTRFDPTLGIEFDLDDQKLSFEEVSQLALRLGQAAHILKLATWRPPLNEKNLLDWAIEVSLQMHAEGLVDTPPDPKDLLDYFQPINGNQANHTLAYTNCQTYIKLSERFRSQMIDWYNSPDWPATIAHELVHVAAQQSSLCRSAPHDQLEATATIGALIILAAMANRGNGTAMRAFVWESLDNCMGTSLALALKTNRLAEYKKLRSVIYPGILSESRYEKLNREYEDDYFGRMAILHSYYLLPVEIIVRSHLTNNDQIEGLILQPKITYPYPSNGLIKTTPRVLDLRDWSWIMRHLLEMSRAFAALPVNSIVR